MESGKTTLIFEFGETREDIALRATGRLGSLGLVGLLSSGGRLAAKLGVLGLHALCIEESARRP